MQDNKETAPTMESKPRVTKRTTDARENHRAAMTGAIGDTAARAYANACPGADAMSMLAVDSAGRLRARAPNAASAVTDSTGRRKKFWDLPAKFHCPIVGTCLSLDELRRLARKAGIEVGTSDYETHHTLVHLAGERGYPARLLQKALERKFAASIKRASICANARSLRDFWERTLAQGDIAGGFWAVLTHPIGDTPLLERVFGDVHMRSHIAGHARGAADRELPRQQQRIAMLETALARASAAMREHTKARERDAAAASHQARRSAQLEQALAAAHARIAEFETGAMFADLRERNAALSAALRQATQRALDAERAHDRALRQTPSLPKAQRPPMHVSVAPTADTPAVATRCASDCPARATSDCPGADLCGQRILYVGGRERQLAHFRALVARRNGELLHHDGGRHESSAQLDALIRAADAVLCPIECVSHDACRRIKRLCKREHKPFVPLRSASLTGFADGLRVVAPSPGDKAGATPSTAE